MSELALPRSTADEHAHGARLLSDELLARLVGRGSAGAFSTLYERHHQALYRYCRSILRNEHDAQDALQSTMTQAYTALSAAEREVSLRAWLFRIAHNESITILRKRGREQDLDLSGVQAQSDGDPHAFMESRGRLRQLVCDLQELPERQRSALVMRELSGLSVEEIAVALAISAAGAKQALFEARSSLHELAEGREMDCEKVCSAISAHDGRVLRGRRIRAHLRDCESCRNFRLAIGAREADLRALAPALPASAATTILARLIGAGHGGGGAGGGGATAAGGSSPSLLAHAGGSLLLKGAAGAAIVAVSAIGTVRLTRASAPEARTATDPRGVLETSSTAHGALGSTMLQQGIALHSGPSGPAAAGAHAGRGRGTTATQTPAATSAHGRQPGEPRARTERSAGANAHRLGEKGTHGKSRQSTHSHSHANGQGHAGVPVKGDSHGAAHGRSGNPTSRPTAGNGTPAAQQPSPATSEKGEARSRPSSQTQASGGESGGEASSGSDSLAGESAPGRSGRK